MRRKVELFFIDSLLLTFVYFVTSFVSTLEISSILLNGEMTVLKLIVFWICIMSFRIVFNIYRRIWRYPNVKSYLFLMSSDTVSGTVFYFLGNMFKTLSLGFAYTFIVLFFNLLITLLSRFLYQFFYDEVDTLKKVKNKKRKDAKKIRVAIVGAGITGASLLKQISKISNINYQPMFFIDIDKEKTGNRMGGIPILKEDEKILKLIKKNNVQEIIFAIQDMKTETKERLYSFYNRTGCKIIVPSYPFEDNVDSSKVNLREIRIEDLLFRDTYSVYNDNLNDFYKDKNILVTGGGGSIGSEICRQIAMLSPKKLTILDNYENNAYEIQQELVRKYGNLLKLDVVIASVRDEQRLNEIFSRLRPDIVIHAAAHKHVPLMERSGTEAIKNNVFGTYNVANMCEKYGVKKMILISTDKAVNPTNIMGATKRLCEMIIQSRKDSQTDFCAVRFGNVLGSNGSVIPLFKKQIEDGGPITITDKRIIRYFMTIPEAVSLVMEAGGMANRGEVFVLDMGKPVKIINLAENMIRLAGLVPYKDIDIVEIGLRKGEKLFEELLMKSDSLESTPNELIFVEREEAVSREDVEEKLEILRSLIEDTVRMDKDEAYLKVIEKIRMTVPTYHLPEEINKVAEESVEMQMVE